MPITGHSDFVIGSPFPYAGPGLVEQGASWMIQFKLVGEVAPLFPLINATVSNAEYFDKPPFIRFYLDEVRCALYPEIAAAGPFEDRVQALTFIDKLIGFLNDLDARQDRIKPNHKTYKPSSILDIFRLLPRTNCQACGFSSCMAFAAAVSRKKAAPARCPEFGEPISIEAVYPVLDPQGNLVSTVTIDVNAEDPILSEPAGFSEGKPVPAEMENAASRGDGGMDSYTPLTPREIEVLRLMADGGSNTEISRELGISPHTVKSHVIHIFNKLGVNGRTQAAVWAARRNLI